MTNEEIWNIGLEERTDELSKLQSEYDRLDVECRKAEFENGYVCTSQGSKQCNAL